MSKLPAGVTVALACAGAVVLGSIAVYALLPRPPRSLAQAVARLKKDGTLPPNVRALPAPESGSLLGYRVTRGEIERNASCYGGTRTEQGTSFSTLEVHYDSARALVQELKGLGSAVHVDSKETSDVKLVLTHVGIAKTTGVFDPLSSCLPGTHEVVVWELRAGEASLVGSRTSLSNVGGEVDAGAVDVSSALKVGSNEAFKVIATNVVIAYLTQTLTTEQSSKRTAWTGDINPDENVALPNSARFPHQMSLKVVSFDRRPGGAFKFRLTGGNAMTATCASNGSPGSLDLSMGVGDSCRVSINDATELVIQTAVDKGEVSVNAILVRTTRVDPPAEAKR